MLDNIYFGAVYEVGESEINILNDNAGIDIDAQPLIDPQNVVSMQESVLLDEVGYIFFGRWPKSKGNCGITGNSCFKVADGCLNIGVAREGMRFLVRKGDKVILKLQNVY